MYLGHGARRLTRAPSRTGRTLLPPPSPLANAVPRTSSPALLHGAGGGSGAEAGGGGVVGAVQP